MARITRDDIQHIEDEETLLHFLEEKLNLPIPEGLPLEDITSKFSNFALGLTGNIAEQVLDCQELGFVPGESSGIILIRFNNQLSYAGALRSIAEGLDKRGHNPEDLRFICMDKYFQPFAFAHFRDSDSKDWKAEVLNVFIWTQENTYIHTSWEHKFPASFFGEEPADRLEDDFEGKTEIKECNVIKRPLGYNLSTKLKTIGTPLGMLENISSGITTAYDRAFIIDARTREYLLAKDPDSIELIKRSPRVNRKWKCETKYLIGILSSHIKQWSWSDARSESEAERVFEEEYPAIYAHLRPHKDGLKKRTKSVQGKFYWEMSSKKLSSTPKRPKIIYPLSPTSMQAAYGNSEGIPTSSFFFIPTSDLSILAILNSDLSKWYVKTNYPKERSSQVSLKKANMKGFPIVPRTEKWKKKLSDLVQQILDAPNSPNVRNLEEEINMLVYGLYELTAAEIALIEKGNNL